MVCFFEIGRTCNFKGKNCIDALIFNSQLVESTYEELQPVSEATFNRGIKTVFFNSNGGQIDEIYSILTYYTRPVFQTVSRINMNLAMDRSSSSLSVLQPVSDCSSLVRSANG